jgi:hypothetical protein
VVIERTRQSALKALDKIAADTAWERGKSMDIETAVKMAINHPSSAAEAD